MPHLRLEYSGNIDITKDHCNRLFSQLHEALVGKANAELLHCQSRAICCEHFYVGDGAKDRGFVYLQVLLLEGRTSLQLQKTGDELLHILQNEFKELLASHNVQISVHLNEIPKDRSYKSNHSYVKQT